MTRYDSIYAMRLEIEIDGPCFIADVSFKPTLKMKNLALASHAIFTHRNCCPTVNDFLV